MCMEGNFGDHTKLERRNETVSWSIGLQIVVFWMFYLGCRITQMPMLEADDRIHLSAPSLNLNILEVADETNPSRFCI